MSEALFLYGDPLDDVNECLKQHGKAATINNNRREVIVTKLFDAVKAMEITGSESGAMLEAKVSLVNCVDSLMRSQEGTEATRTKLLMGKRAEGDNAATAGMVVDLFRQIRCTGELAKPVDIPAAAIKDRVKAEGQPILPGELLEVPTDVPQLPVKNTTPRE